MSSKEMQIEFEALLDERIRRDEEITQTLKREGKYIAGLDTHQEEYLKVSKWFAEQVEALKEKYKDLA